MASGFSLKDQLFNLERVRYLAGLFSDAPGFDASRFEARVMERLPELELKARIAWIATCLEEAMPGDLSVVDPAIRNALPPPLDPTKSDDDFGSFIFAPLGEWVVNTGLEDPDRGLGLLREITQRFSMEWAIRPFLNRWPDLVLARMDSWVEDDHYHVRRLVSEGTRPRLPWGQGVSLPLDAGLPLLDRLHGDPTRFVTRSVANHLNDITKKEPDLVLARLAQWRDEGRQADKELAWMTAHALRGLVKAGHPGALEMLGFDAEVDLECELRLGRDSLRIGEALDIGCEITGAQAMPVLVDYIIWFAKPDGGQRSKVFKLKQGKLTAGKPLILLKSHRLKGDATTFRLSPGRHAVGMQVNGKLRARADFTLLPAAE
ncbi:hypothetical protein GI582_10395 [Sulfitobacter sp. BDSS02]|nr:hypothetical protein [Sulfitobacter sp. BDSS02]MBR9852165.1 hypothetical protein [Paracoccaceae bacterium]